MEFKEIAAVSGKTGLFRILKPTRNGVVLETLDEKREKLIISSNTKVSILKDISMYTLSAEGNMPLAEIMIAVKNLFGDSLPVTTKSDEKELRGFFLKVVPDFDSERVYTSDIKKLVGWFGLISANCPEVLKPQTHTAPDETSVEEPVTSDSEVETPKKAKEKKTPEAEMEQTPMAEAVEKSDKEPKPKKAKA